MVNNIPSTEANYNSTLNLNHSRHTKQFLYSDSHWVRYITKTCIAWSAYPCINYYNIKAQWKQDYIMMCMCVCACMCELGHTQITKDWQWHLYRKTKVQNCSTHRPVNFEQVVHKTDSSFQIKTSSRRMAWTETVKAKLEHTQNTKLQPVQCMLPYSTYKGGGGGEMLGHTGN